MRRSRGGRGGVGGGGVPQRVAGTNNNISLRSCGLISALAWGDPAGVGSSCASLIALLLVLILSCFCLSLLSSFFFLFFFSSFVIVLTRPLPTPTHTQTHSLTLVIGFPFHDFLFFSYRILSLLLHLLLQFPLLFTLSYDDSKGRQLANCGDHANNWQGSSWTRFCSPFSMATIMSPKCMHPSLWVLVGRRRLGQHPRVFLFFLL